MITLNGGGNPTAIKYVKNGVATDITEVWFKTNSSATPIKVWPIDPLPANTFMFYPYSRAVQIGSTWSYWDYEQDKKQGKIPDNWQWYAMPSLPLNGSFKPSQDLPDGYQLTRDNNSTTWYLDSFFIAHPFNGLQPKIYIYIDDVLVDTLEGKNTSTGYKDINLNVTWNTYLQQYIIQHGNNSQWTSGNSYVSVDDWTSVTWKSSGGNGSLDDPYGYLYITTN